MKVAIFIDGKNFYRGYRAYASDRRLDFPAMARWLVERAGGSFLWGVYYYTGIERGPAGHSEEQSRLRRFLDMLELQPGFFVQRFARKAAVTTCPVCQRENRYTKEKEVDTTMVADMLRLAAVGAFDIMVLVSGDADHAPAVEGVRSLGKQAFVATWSGDGLSPRIRRAAFDHIDLVGGVPCFGASPKSGDSDRGGVPLPSEHEEAAPPAPASPAPSAALDEPHVEASADEEFLLELQRAEAHFSHGYVGVSLFLNQWRASRLNPTPDIRRRILDRLKDAGKVEVYEASDGKRALRTRRRLAD